MPACYKRERSTSGRSSYFRTALGSVWACRGSSSRAIISIDFEPKGGAATQWNNVTGGVSWKAFMADQKALVRAMKWAGL